MPWDSIGEFSLSSEWQLSSPVQGELFRVTHNQSSGLGNNYIKGVIAQAFTDSGMNIFNGQRLSHREEKEIFLFNFPVGLAVQSIAVKRLDFTPSPWVINIEVFSSNNASEDLTNYLVSRFGDILPLLESINSVNIQTMSTQSLGLSPVFNVVNDIGGSLTCKLFVPANPLRESLIIRSNKDPLFLFTGDFVDVNGQKDYTKPTIFLQEIPKNSEVELIRTPNGIYKGEIWARQARNESLTYTEYSVIIPE